MIAEIIVNGVLTLIFADTPQELMLQVAEARDQEK